ncbi:MAG: glycerol-3-phosphate 1-O-acyltransferase PlsY [Pseudomonadota bacterium]
MEYFLAAIFGYLLGSIPFGLVLCKIFGYGDIRKIGSGNIGATNVLRTGNKPLAFATLVLDIGKGAIAVFLIRLIFPENCSVIDCQGPCPCISYNDVAALSMIAGFFALIGHCFPAWLKFKGGKGVATTLGTFLAIQPILGLIICGLWFISVLIFRISSLSALIAVGLSPLIAHYIYNDANLSFFCAAVAALVYIKHRDNIKRLFTGQEPKIGKKNKEKTSDA